MVSLGHGLVLVGPPTAPNAFITARLPPLDVPGGGAAVCQKPRRNSPCKFASLAKPLRPWSRPQA